MTKHEFYDLIHAIWELWPDVHSHRPRMQDANGKVTVKAQQYIALHYAVVADLEFADAFAAVMSLAETSRWEPSMADVRRVATSSSGWADASRRLADAVAAHEQAEPPKRSFEQDEHGNWHVVLEDGYVPERWRKVAGERVADIIDQMGGIHRAVEGINDTTYRAQFRELYLSAQDAAPQQLASGRDAVQRLLANAPQSLLDAVPSLERAAQGMRSLPRSS